jgi:hypothetical protein
VNDENNEGPNVGDDSIVGDNQDSFRIIKTTAIPDITEVRYYDETIDHIREQHTELTNYFPSFDHAICDAIENPTHVYKTNTSPQSSGFRYTSTRSTYEGNPLVVIVKPIETTSGVVKTAYFAGQVPGNLLYSSQSPSEPEAND